MKTWIDMLETDKVSLGKIIKHLEDIIERVDDLRETTGEMYFSGNMINTTEDGLCFISGIDLIGRELKKSITVCWSEYIPEYTPVYPVSGHTEYNETTNLWHNPRRLQLVFHYHKCLTQIFKNI